MRKISSAMIILTALCSLVHAEKWILKDELRSQSPATLKLEFLLPDSLAEQQVRLGLDARIDWPGFDGSNPWIIVAVNGSALSGPALLNKPVECVMRCGMDTTWVTGNSWRLCYSPDFSDAIRTAEVPFGWPDVDPYHFLWDITPHVTAGKNVLSISHLHILTEPTTLVLRNIFVESGTPITPPTSRTGDSESNGHLRTYIAANEYRRIPLEVAVSSDGGIFMELGSRSFEFTTRTSEPDGQWITTGAGVKTKLEYETAGRALWRGTNYNVAREVTLKDDHIQVNDQITNTSDAVIGVIYENYFQLPPQYEKVLFCGLPRWSQNQQTPEPRHPTALAQWKDLAVGMVAESDVFRAHVRVFSRGEDLIGLKDPELGIPAGQSHTMKWSIYPLAQGDYWDFINAVRRNWGCNITIPAMAFAQTMDASKPADYYRQWTHRRALQTIFIGGQTSYLDQSVILADGSRTPKLAEGTDIPKAALWGERTKSLISKLQEAAPDVSPLIYLHPGACTEDNAIELYADSRHLGPHGEHYSTPYYYPIYLYVPSLENSYGKALMQTVKYIIDDLDAGGIFMDEMEFGGTVGPYAYQIQWDQATALIDPDTHELTGLCSNTYLLTLPWKMAMIDYIRQKGKLIIGNTCATTHSMIENKVLRLTENGSLSFLVNTHLNCPWALAVSCGDHSDAARAALLYQSLDKACVYSLYTWEDEPPQDHFVKIMSPITPVRLQKGMLLGQERILTNRSGIYGWPDGSDADVYVYDSVGKRLMSPAVKRLPYNQGYRFEIRLEAQQFAILVRAPQS